MKPATAAQPRIRQGELGQFLTAEPVAEFMASMFWRRLIGVAGSAGRQLDSNMGAG